VIRVSESLSNDRPSLIIVELFDIKKDSKQLYSCNSGMSIIQLNLVQFREVIPVCVIKLEAFNNILNSC
jgi:hypothetical protein